MTTLFNDDDDDSFFDIVNITAKAAANSAAAAKKTEPAAKASSYGDAKPNKGNEASQAMTRLVATIPGIRAMPVRDRLPFIEGWASEAFWSKPMPELMAQWQKEYGNDIDYAFVLGDHCGQDSGDLVLEADNEAGEQWLRENAPATPTMVSTRRGFNHRHYRIDMAGRGNRIDIFGSVKKHKKAALDAGFKVELPRGRKATEEERAARDSEMAKALAAIPMGPVIDLKCNGGQAMAPGGRNSKTPNFRYEEVGGLWTIDMWRARPVFDPKWFPDSVWARELAADTQQGSHASYDVEYWTLDRRVSAAMRYAANMKPTVSGEGAHSSFLRNAILIVRGFDLDVQSGRRVLTYWGQQVCAHEPWSTKEIEHKLESALQQGKEPMGFKLAARRGDETVGERYAAMMRAMANDSMTAELEGDLISEVMNDAAPTYRSEGSEDQDDGTVDPFDMSPVEVPAASPASALASQLPQTTPMFGPGSGAATATKMTVAARAAGASDAAHGASDIADSERQVLAELGMDIADIISNPKIGVIYKRIEGKVVRLPPTTLNLAQFLMHSRMFKGRLRKNLMNHEMEFDNVGLESIHTLKTTIDTLFQEDVPKERIEDSLETVGLYCRYDPSLEEFEKLPPWDGEERLMRVAGEVLPVESASLYLSKVKMAKSIMAMVARTLDPGCKVDTIPIFIGKQGARKSSFWEMLAGPKFFSDTAMQNIGGRDEMWLISRFRVIEIPEIDGMYSKHQNAQMKAFFSKRRDDYRLPYARRMVSVARRSIMVGTTNEHEILSDPTGSRRYWPIPTIGKARLDLLGKWRDQLLAEAIHKVSAHLVAKAAGREESKEYKEGMWWLDDQQDEERSKDNLKYQEDDPWRPAIEEFLRPMTPDHKFQVADVIDYLKLPIDRVARRDSIRIANILNNLACRRFNEGRPTTVDKKNGRWWEPPASQDPLASTEE